ARAERLWPGEGGKTEAWLVLDASPKSRIYAGLLPGVDESALRRTLGRGKVAECLHAFTPQPGDCLFLPAGTVHAVGGGVLLAEVQQSSDATFRLYDWDRCDAQGRSRTLHIEEALACIDWRAGPVEPVRVASYPQTVDEVRPEPATQALVRCRYFHLDYIRRSEMCVLPGGRMRVLLVLHGQGGLLSPASTEPLAPGDTLLLPAALGDVGLYPLGP